MSNVTVLRVDDCAVPFCTETVHKVNSRPFPKYSSEPQLFTLWMKLISNSDLENLSVKQIQCFRVCEKHFTSFNVPTNFLPKASNDELMKFLINQKTKIAQKKHLEENHNEDRPPVTSKVTETNSQTANNVKPKRRVCKIVTKTPEKRPVKVKRVYVKIGNSDRSSNRSDATSIQPEAQVEKVIEETVAVRVQPAPASSRKIVISPRSDTGHNDKNNNTSKSSQNSNILKENVIKKISGKLSEVRKKNIENFNESTTSESIVTNETNPTIVLDNDCDEEEPEALTDTSTSDKTTLSTPTNDIIETKGKTIKWTSTAINMAINNWPKFKSIVYKGKKPPVVFKVPARSAIRKPNRTAASAATPVAKPVVVMSDSDRLSPSIPVINLIEEPVWKPTNAAAIATTPTSATSTTDTTTTTTTTKTIQPIQLLSIRTTLAKTSTPKRKNTPMPVTAVTAPNSNDNTLQIEIDDEESIQNACLEKYKHIQEIIRKKTSNHTKVYKNIGFHVDECVPIAEFKQLQAQKVELEKSHRLELRVRDRENNRLKRLNRLRAIKAKNLAKRVRELNREIAEISKLPNDLKEFFRNQVQHNKSGRGNRAYSDKEKEMALLITGANPVLLRNYNKYFFGPTLKTLRKWRQMLEKSVAEDEAVASIVSKNAVDAGDDCDADDHDRTNTNENVVVDNIVHQWDLNSIQMNLNGIEFDSEHLENNPNNFSNSLNAIFQQNYVPDNLLQMEIPSDNEDTVYLTF